LTALHCYRNKLTSLNASNCTKLTELYCDSRPLNPLTSLDVSNCSKLERLTCTRAEFTTLDVSDCVALKSLDVSSNDKLTTLDVSNCTKLERLDVGSCYALKILYVSGDIKPNLYDVRNVKVERKENHDLSQSKSLPNPKGTISINMRNADYGNTIVTPSGFKSGFYIGSDNNFRSRDYTFVRIGKVKGLGNTFERNFPETGWTDIVAVTPGYGYLAKYEYNDNGRWKTRHIRIYVVREILSAEEPQYVLGAEIEYIVEELE
jgi:hypothetical protein